MGEQKQEQLHFDDVDIPIYRRAQTETYLALQPPTAAPYLITQNEIEPEVLVKFVQERVGIINELREDMLKRYQKSTSLKCHYTSGDVAYLFGRPFMLRVFPLPHGKKMKHGAHGRVNVNCKMHSDVSVIDLFVMQTGNHDQGRAAFEAFALPVFESNVRNVLRQCRAKAGLPDGLTATVRVRPMRTGWVHVDVEHNSTWVSQDLLPYPVDCTAYGFLVDACKKLMPDASVAEREAMFDTALPNWRSIKNTLEDPDNIYKRQLKSR